MSTTTIAVIAVALPALWIFGGIVLRISGLLAFFSGCAGMALGFDPGSSLLVGAIGALLWLAGHWLFALRHQEFKSPLARHLFAHLPSVFDPTRLWAIPAAEPRREHGRRGT